MVKQNPKTNAQGKKLKVKVKRDVAKVLNKNALVQRKLLAMNPYLQSLLNPFHVSGARIPDDQSYPSSTFSITQRISVTVNANGIAAAVIGAYFKNATQVEGGSLVPVATVAGTYDYVLGQFSQAASTTTGLFQTAVSPATDGIYFDRWTVANNTIPSVFQYIRPVSMGASIDYLGATLNAKGKITCGFAPKNQWRGRSNIGVDDIFRFPGSSQVPVNKLVGGSVFYRPLDYTSFNYTNQDAKFDMTSVLTTEPTYGSMYLAVDGATAGDTVVFTIVAHYEAVPRTNQIDLVGVSPSRSDPIALSHAMNVIQNVPNSLPVSVYSQPELIGTSGGTNNLSTGSFTAPVQTGFTNTSSVAPETSMLDNVLGGISKVVDAGSEIIPKALPLIEMIMAAL